MKVKSSDWHTLRYFHEEKGDVTSWCNWNEFAKNNPAVKTAYDQMIAHQQIFELVINGLEVTEDEE